MVTISDGTPMLLQAFTTAVCIEAQRSRMVPGEMDEQYKEVSK
jgi:hypothetical protein